MTQKLLLRRDVLILNCCLQESTITNLVARGELQLRYLQKTLNKNIFKQPKQKYLIRQLTHDRQII